MAEMDVLRLVQEIANLRLQVNALQVTAKNESLPASMRETRSTLRWATIVISTALVLSSALKYCSDSRVEHLERRVDMLEKYHTAPASP